MEPEKVRIESTVNVKPSKKALAKIEQAKKASSSVSIMRRLEVMKNAIIGTLHGKKDEDEDNEDSE